MDNSACSEGQQNNPDISGVGVRISFYLQTIFLGACSTLQRHFKTYLILHPVLLIDRSWEDAPSALWTFIATSFGLTVAAIAQVRNQSLSFFQALQVSNLVW